MAAVDVLTSIDAVPPDEWDAVSGGRPFTQHRWLRLAEAVLADHRPWYLVVRRDGRLAAAATGSIEHRLQNPALDARFGALVRRWPFLQIRVPMTPTAGLLVAEKPDEDAHLPELLATVRAAAAEERFAFCLVDHLPLDHPVLAAPHGFTELPWLPDTRLLLPWTSFEEYLASLSSKRRREIGRLSRRAAAEGIVVEPLAPAPEHAPTLDRLVANVLRRHGATYSFRPDLFGRAAAVIGDDLTLLAAHRHGRLVGCIALLRCGDDLDVRWIGRDYEHTADTAVYHALLAACVRAGIAAGARRLGFGAAAYDAKRQFGVTIEPRTRLFGARSRVATWLVGRLGQRLAPPAMPDRPAG